MDLPDISRSFEFPPHALDSMAKEATRRGQVQDSTIFLADFHRASLASAFAEKLTKAIEQFDAGLDASHEVGMRLVTFGQSIVFHVEDLRYHNPSLLFFRGTTPEGHKVELIQHVSQVSFLLMALPKPDPNQPKRRFGLSHYHTTTDSDSGFPTES